MAINTSAEIDVFGTQDALNNSSSSVSANAFSVAADLLQWTNDDDTRFASAVLEAVYSSAPDANSVVNLYAQLIDIVSTSDQDAPDSNYQHVLVGQFPLNDVTSSQFIPVDIELPNVKTSQIYQFFIENKGGQTISAGWDLHITPKASAPRA